MEEGDITEGEDGQDSIRGALDSYLTETGLRGVILIQQLSPDEGA